MLKLLLALTLLIQVIFFSQDASELALWIPGLVIGTIGLAVNNRAHFSASDLFFILFLFLFVVAPADQFDGGRFQGELSVRGIIFPEHIIRRSVLLVDLFGLCVLCVCFASRLIPRKEEKRTSTKYLNSIAPSGLFRRKSAISQPTAPHSNESFIIVDEVEYKEPEIARQLNISNSNRRRVIQNSTSVQYLNLSRRRPINWMLASFTGINLFMILMMWTALDGGGFITDGRDYPHRLYDSNPALAVLTQAFLQMLPLVGLVCSIVDYQRSRDRQSIFWLIVLGQLCLIFNNPFNSARFLFGAECLMILLFALKGKIRSSYCYAGLIIYVLFLMPLMNLLRNGGIRALGEGGDISFTPNLRQLDFDAFSMFVFSVFKTGDSDFSGGSYFLSIVFFFVPRAIWEGKPAVSSIDLGKSLMQHHSGWFTNLSCPPFGDFYMDFGVIGVFLCGLLYGLMLKWTDGVISTWNDRSMYARGVAATMMGLLPILVRGSLGSIIGSLVVSIIIFSLLPKRRFAALPSISI